MIQNDDDYALALYLQEELNDDSPVIQECSNGKSVSIVDSFWELNDPNPDIHGLFLEFNSNYFWNKLDGVEVKWSNRMTLCAGICGYEGHGGLCSIRLSLPLLKLRPRKDLVETLLDHDSHGPEFLKHMFRINKLTGANITVYHNFHDEVNSYRQHWWRCNGPCRTKPPFYGIVRRAMNRAPSSVDYWWAEHERSCGGVFVKIKEPENNISKRKPEVNNKSSSPKKSKFAADIRTFFKSKEKEKNGNMCTEKKSFDTSKGKSLSNNGFRSNIHTLNDHKDKNVQKYPVVPYQGKGKTLGSLGSNGDSKTSKLMSLYCVDKNSDRLHSSSESSHPSTSGGVFTPERQKSKSIFSSPPLSNITFRKKPSSTSKLQNMFYDRDRMRPEVLNLTDPSNLSKTNIKRSKSAISTASPLNYLKDIWEKSSTSSSNQMKIENYGTQTAGENSKLGKKSEVDDTSCKVLVACPVCCLDVVETEINSHLDNCLP
ncbi:sprT-like domain-containing protein Spartan isoform X2 [Centruroides sculpturatus]|uniref:sprT-like domain-containing protein Spartan isoform X2 n=1 Tax=Centruroides sculpturatus TaxID=218467 RepID=UPI000C6DCB21|nr:sprT-like domain-containing protein Spartan isoform X2 [Centruroides sculpturatus]